MIYRRGEWENSEAPGDDINDYTIKRECSFAGEGKALSPLCNWICGRNLNFSLIQIRYNNQIKYFVL